MPPGPVAVGRGHSRVCPAGRCPAGPGPLWPRVFPGCPPRPRGPPARRGRARRRLPAGRGQERDGGVGDTAVTGHRSPKCGGSHLVAFGAGRSPDARLTRQPRDTGHARGARVPGAASVTLAKRGDKAGTGRAGDKARRGHSPLCHHQRHQEPPRAPLTFCPFSPASPGLPWGNAGMSQAGASPPKKRARRARGALTALPGGPPAPLSPGGPGTATSVAVPWRACGLGGHCPHCSPCGGTSRLEGGVGDNCGVGGGSRPPCPPHLSAVPCQELHGSQPGRWQGQGRDSGVPNVSPSLP